MPPTSPLQPRAALLLALCLGVAASRSASASWSSPSDPAPPPPAALPTPEEMKPYPSYGTKAAAPSAERPGGASPLGQTPFHILDLFLLEDRLVRIQGNNVQYSAAHHENGLSDRGWNPALPFLPDVSDPDMYRGRWPELVHEADGFWAMGGFEVAEKRFLFILGMLRKVQGPDSDAVAMMLDHIGELYLDERDFDGAHATLTEALKVRRKTLAAMAVPPGATAARGDSEEPDPRTVFRLHLSELLTRLGQLDLARGSLDLAARELGEAIEISNEPAHLNYVNGLFAVYFQSVLWEEQGKWQEAEALWRDAVARRAPLGDSVAFWSAQKELALFYARHGDFHTAAALARKIFAETARKELASAEEMPYDSNWPHTQQVLYWREGSVALSEILAIDTWKSEGAAAAVKLLREPLDRSIDDPILSRSGAAERAQLLSWLERRVFLHLSLLLDGDPSPERVKAAYELLCRIKGRYMATETYVHRLVEAERGNPSVQDPVHLAELDQLADVRQQLAHRFITEAVFSRRVGDAELAALETREGAVSRALSAYAEPRLPPYLFNPPQGSWLADGTLVIDYFKWRRSDRQTGAVLPAEYGAFVTRRGEATRYVSLGPAAPIDRDIQSLTTPGQPISREVLGRLYQSLLAPIEGGVEGATGAAGKKSGGGARKLWIVPDGLLTLAPFAAFLDGTGHPLLERATIVYLNTVRDLYPADTEAPLASPPVIVANPNFDRVLGGAAAAANAPPSERSLERFAAGGSFESEARAIGRHLGVVPGRIVTGGLASEELVESLAGPEVLHLATHSIPNLEWRIPGSPGNLFEYPSPLTKRNPALQSLIALAGANREQTGIEDGFLTGLEVEGLHLVGTKLVVLASCEAGQVLPVDGEGLSGLRTAFAMAGAEGVVTNLWKSDDEATGKLMDLFYSRLKDGAEAAEALRLAQLQMLRDPSYGAPFYWAGFQYAGTPALSLHRRAGAPPDPEQSSLVAPHCLEVTAREAPDKGWQTVETVRVRLGAVAHRVSLSATRAVYEMAVPGSEAEYTWGTSVNGGPPIPSPEVQTASRIGWGITVAVERQPGRSGLSITIGKKETPIVTLKFEGAPDLFPTLDFPAELPPLASYKAATLWTDKAAKIEALEACQGGSLR